MTFKDDVEQLKVRNALWRKGKLSFLLDETQKEMQSAFVESQERIFILLCSRRLGKTWLLLITALEMLMSKKCKIIYITDSYKSAKEIVRPTMEQLLETCPRMVRPKYKTQDSKYVFPNGSEMLLIGSDRNPDSCRGQQANLVIIDEAGFVEHLKYLIDSVIKPALMLTGGRIFIGTTPPKNEDHDFLGYLAQAEAKGAVVKKTIYDCPRLTPKQIADAMEDAGGDHTDSWKREYLVQIIRNKETTVLIEFDDKAMTDIVTPVPTVKNPFDKYVGMDLGFTDNTGLVFGYYDFVTGTVMIQREMLIEKENTSKIANKIKKLERDIWEAEPYRRTADSNNPQLIFDLSDLHKLVFCPDPRVGTKEQRINRVRLMIQNRQIRIDPSCINLITQMRFCKWKNAERASFVRTPQYGHFDLVDALIIMVSNIDFMRNPLPASYNIHVQANIPSQEERHTLQSLVSPKLAKIRRKNIWI